MIWYKNTCLLSFYTCHFSLYFKYFEQHVYKERISKYFRKKFLSSQHKSNFQFLVISYTFMTISVHDYQKHIKFRRLKLEGPNFAGSKN